VWTPEKPKTCRIYVGTSTKNPPPTRQILLQEPSRRRPAVEVETVQGAPLGPTMSLAKVGPDGLKDRKCKKMTFYERPPIPYVPEKNSVQETVSSFKEAHLKTLIKEGKEL
jgi:hypothetical protein